MLSQYRPQLLGWIDDLDKGTNYLSGADDRLLYANDNYCAFLRKTSSDQIFYLCISFICTIASIFLIPSLSYALSSCNSKTVYFLLLTFLFCFILVLYLMIPELYQNLFT